MTTDDKDNLMDNLLGKAPEAEPMEEEVVQKTAEDPVQDNTEEAEKAKDAEPEKKVLVPHAAFHEERERRKELQKKVAEQDERYAKLEERQTKIFEALTTRQAPAQEEYVDPLVALENEVKSLKGKLETNDKQVDENTKLQQKEIDFLNKYQASADAFSKDRPDFTDAYNFLLREREKELAVFIKDPLKLKQRLAMDERTIVEEAFNNEQNPGEVLFELAKTRGYKAKAAEPSTNKIDDLDRGLKASKTLGNAGGKSDNDMALSSLSPTDLAEMSNEEFDALYNKLKKQSKR